MTDDGDGDDGDADDDDDEDEDEDETAGNPRKNKKHIKTYITHLLWFRQASLISGINQFDSAFVAETFPDENAPRLSSSSCTSWFFRFGPNGW